MITIQNNIITVTACGRVETTPLESECGQAILNLLTEGAKFVGNILDASTDDRDLLWGIISKQAMCYITG
jgi:hypothetical protein